MLSGYLTALAWQAVKLGIRSDSNADLTALAWQAVKLGNRSDSNAEWLPHSSCMAGSEVGY